MTGRPILVALRLQETAAAVLVTAFLGLGLSSRVLAVPNLAVGGMSAMPMLALVSLLPAVILLHAWRSWPPTMLAGAVRPVAGAAAAQLLVVCLLVASVDLVTGTPLAGPGASIARNTLGYVGVGLLAWYWCGRDVAVAAPPALLACSLLFGRIGDRLTWDFVVEEATSRSSWLVPLGCALLGLALVGRLPRRDVRRAEREAG